jgi:hypothetical protein
MVCLKVKLIMNQNNFEVVPWLIKIQPWMDSRKQKKRYYRPMQTSNLFSPENDQFMILCLSFDKIQNKHTISDVL